MPSTTKWVHRVLRQYEGTLIPFTEYDCSRFVSDLTHTVAQISMGTADSILVRDFFKEYIIPGNTLSGTYLDELLSEQIIEF